MMMKNEFKNLSRLLHA